MSGCSASRRNGLDPTVNETRYSVAGVPSGPFVAGGTESSGALFARVSTSPLDRLTVVLGVRGDFWQSTPRDSSLSTHSAEFFSPRASAAWTLSPVTSVHASIYRAHRTPTLNELHRDFAVGNMLTRANPELDPERLTGVDGGVLFAWRRLSARLTGFWNELDGAITNVTLTPPPVPGQITRQRQNTDTVRAEGIRDRSRLQAVPCDGRWERWPRLLDRRSRTRPCNRRSSTIGFPRSRRISSASVRRTSIRVGSPALCRRVGSARSSMTTSMCSSSSRSA